MRTAFIDALCRLAGEDERIWLVVGDLGFSVTETFRDRYPQRFLNAGVAEQAMTGIATGLALSGQIVFTYSIANFPTLRCLEQVRNDVCYHAANVKIVSVGAGFAYGAQGYTHHGVENLAILRTLPGMTVVAPADPVESRLATEAVARRDGPCYLALGRAGEPVVHPADPPFEIGRAITVRDGSDATIISTGGMLKRAVEAAEGLASGEAALSVRVLSMHTLKPLDEAAVLAAADETGAVVTVEEHTTIGGLGDAAASVLARRGRGVAFEKVAVADRIEHRAGTREHLVRYAAELPEAVRRLAGGG
jgi:transketolase